MVLVVMLGRIELYVVSIVYMYVFCRSLFFCYCLVLLLCGIGYGFID